MVSRGLNSHINVGPPIMDNNYDKAPQIVSSYSPVLPGRPLKQAIHLPPNQTNSLHLHQRTSEQLLNFPKKAPHPDEKLFLEKILPILPGERDTMRPFSFFLTS